MQKVAERGAGVLLQGTTTLQAGSVAAPASETAKWSGFDDEVASGKAHRLLPIKGEAKRVHPKPVAVVTGGSRGIGLEIVRQLAQKGHTVVLTSRDPKTGKAAVAALKKEGLDVVYQRLDVTNQRSAGSLAGFVQHTFGRCDVLVNNAGTLLEPLSDIDNPQAKGLLDLKPDTFRKTFEVNAMGPINVARAVAPLMEAQGSGRIINISSRLGAIHDAGPGAPAYRISKATLNSVTVQLAEELKSHGVSVNAVDPGWVRTDLGGENAPLSPAQGAETAVWLATLPKEEMPNGGFYKERALQPW